MANYYVSATRGSNSNNGTSPATPWLTIAKAIGASPAITLSGSGDTLWIEPGIYREVVTLSLSPTSGGPLSIIGDYDGAGFLAGGYSSPITGAVEWRGWSNSTTPITTSEVLLASGKSYVTLQGIKFIGSNSGTTASCLTLSGSWSNWTIQDCIFFGITTKPYICRISGTAGAAMNLTVQRCDFISCINGFSVDLIMPLNGTTEYNANVLVQNCRFIGNTGGIRWSQSGGSGTAWATGLTIKSCSFFCTSGAAISTSVSAGITLTTPIGVYGCNIQLCATGLSAANTSQIAEDWNIICAPAATLRTNVTAGGNSITNGEPAFDCGDGRISRAPLRPFGEPSATGLILGFSSYGSPPTDDLYNQTRPGTASAGALERDVFPGDGPFGGVMSCY